jgi:uncharacterized protein (DUF305 family)
MNSAPRLVALLVTAVLTLTACGKDTAEEGSGGSFNDADVAFAQGMITHHQQAVEMAQIAETNAGSAEVKQLADRIEAAQQPEIETMTTWLEGWGEEVPSGGTEHSEMGHHEDDGGMGGMMDAETLKELEQSSGDRFDTLFLTSMVDHHEGAIEMARTEQTDGESPDAVSLAEKVESDQEAEIATMQELLGS